MLPILELGKINANSPMQIHAISGNSLLNL